jgi:drug/metabolite transporter (DMT)-like permease
VLAILLAGLSAAVWGTGDYCGGKASRRANALTVTVLSQLAGLPVLGLSILLVAGTPTPAVLGWSAVAGAAGFAGILLLYRGLAGGAMVIFAPVSAATAAVVPMGVGLVLGDRPGPLPLVGAGCAVVAIGLVSTGGARPAGDEGARSGLRQIGLALASGVLFGIFFSLIGEAGTGAGMWPLVGVRGASLSIGALALVGTRTPLRMPAPALRWALVAGLFDVLANALYLAAAGRGLLSLVAPIGALYPVSTVLLAFLVDRERVRPAQLAGLGLAATALVLVAG